MAIQRFTGNETGRQFINKLNENFSGIQGGGSGGGIRIKMERGGLKDSGAIEYTRESYSGNVRSSMLIKLNGATSVNGINFHDFTIYEFNSSFAKIKTSNEGDTFDENCSFIKITKQTNSIIDDAILLFDGEVEEVYNVQMETASETLVFEVSEDICTTARLKLPYNYAINGKKVPLIIWCACDGSYPNWNFTIDKVGSTPSSISSHLQYLTDEGFAVLNVYPWGSYNFSNFPNCGQSGAVPVPTVLRAYEKAVNYVTTRFNISDTNIFLSSWSGSGKLSSFYAIHKPIFNLRHIYSFAPVVDGGTFRISGEKLNDGSGFRGAVAAEMNFEGDVNSFLTRWSNTINTQNEIDFVTANAGKFAKYSSIKWQNLVGSYMKDGVLHNHNIDDKIADSVSWGNKWRQAIGYPNVPSSFNDWTIFTDSSRQDYTPIYNRNELVITSNGVPITIIGATDDAACPFLAMKEFIDQLKNGGGEAKIIDLCDSAYDELSERHNASSHILGHRSAIFYNKQSVTTKRGTTYSAPFGWWYMVQDIKARFLKN
jgi:hypothetical protein